MNFMNANELSITLFACVLTFNSINGWTIVTLDSNDGSPHSIATLQALQRNIGTITAAKCGQWYRFMQTYIPRCLNNEEIEGKLQNITFQYTVIEQFWNLFFPSWLLLLHTFVSSR